MSSEYRTGTGKPSLHGGELSGVVAEIDSIHNNEEIEYAAFATSLEPEPEQLKQANKGTLFDCLPARQSTKWGLPMNKVAKFPTMPTTAATAMVAALTTAGHASWPDREAAVYVTTHDLPTSNSPGQPLAAWSPSSADGFGQEIAAIHESLLGTQEPLGAEFEAVWDANVTQLYES